MDERDVLRQIDPTRRGGSRLDTATAEGERLKVRRGAAPVQRIRLSPSSSATDLDGVIADLQRRHQQLSDYIDEHHDEMRPGQFITAIDYQGRLANRIGRLLRDRQQLAGEQTDALDEAVAEALAIAGEAWGVALDAKG